jgi:putative heme-binding domain-containing protein
MRRLTLIVAAICLAMAGDAAAVAGFIQASAVARDADAIQAGMRSFRGRCARCHGNDARGIQAPDLTISASVLDDAAMFRVIRVGVPGTEMPAGGPTTMTEMEVWRIVAYLRTLAGSQEGPPRGNPENGARIFWERAGCGACHWVQGRGGRLGPELSRIGAARSQAFLAAKIRNPNERLVRGYEPVTVVTTTGDRFVGIRRDEDTFSIQLFDAAERLHFFPKADVREVVTGRRSLMPEFGANRLSDGALDDLVAYLATLRG